MEVEYVGFYIIVFKKRILQQTELQAQYFLYMIDKETNFIEFPVKSTINNSFYALNRFSLDF